MNTDNNSIRKEDFSGSIIRFLRETFEGTTPDGNSFIDKGTGIFDTIGKISAADASKSIGKNDAGIAAHLEHARFYLVVLLEFIEGRTEKVDWSESWSVKNVGETEWDLLKENLRSEYAKVTEKFQTIETWDDDKISDALGIVVHTAYHLGAIRQILKTVSG